MSLSNLARIPISYPNLFSPRKYRDSTFQWAMTFLRPFRFTGIIIHKICLFIFVSMTFYILTSIKLSKKDSFMYRDVSSTLSCCVNTTVTGWIRQHWWDYCHYSQTNMRMHAEQNQCNVFILFLQVCWKV